MVTRNGINTQNPILHAEQMATKVADYFKQPGNLSWLASLDTSAKPAKKFRRTSIMYVVCR